MPATTSLHKKALLLEWFTVGYNVLEGVFSIVAGYLSGSIALIGFGLDSAIESASGIILIWRLSVTGKVSPEQEEKIEKRAVFLVGISFFILGAYVFFEAARKLYLHEHPDPSLFGIVIAALSAVIMPLLSYSKLSIARKMKSKSLEADSRQTFICSLLSIALLIGLGLNFLWGIWWADPLSALVIVVFIVREGFEALREERCC